MDKTIYPIVKLFQIT